MLLLLANTKLPVNFDVLTLRVDSKSVRQIIITIDYRKEI